MQASKNYLIDRRFNSIEIKNILSNYTELPQGLLFSIFHLRRAVNIPDAHLEVIALVTRRKSLGKDNILCSLREGISLQGSATKCKLIVEKERILWIDASVLTGAVVTVFLFNKCTISIHIYKKTEDQRKIKRIMYLIHAMPP